MEHEFANILSIKAGCRPLVDTYWLYYGEGRNKGLAFVGNNLSQDCFHNLVG